MPGLRLADTIAQLSVEDDGWGPETVTSTTLDGVPYAPYSKGDKLGRMADWTQEGKEGAQRGNRNYNRNYRGEFLYREGGTYILTLNKINKFMAQAHLHCLPSK
jgi:translation initiation factor 3 subunit D